MDILEQIFHDHSLKLVDMDKLLKEITKDTLIYCGKDKYGNPMTYQLTKDYVQGYRDSYEELKKEIIEKIIKKPNLKI